MLRRVGRFLLFVGPLIGALFTASREARSNEEVVSADRGVLDTTAVAPKHAVLLDGQNIGTTPGRFVVPCGKHRLRVIRKQRERPVEIPCRGELVVGANMTLSTRAPAPETVDAQPPDAAEQDAGTPPEAASEVETPSPRPVEPASPGPTTPTHDAPHESPAPSESRLGGRISSYVRPPMLDPLHDPIQQVSGSVWLETRPRFGENTSAAATVSVDAIRSSVDPNTTLRARVREAFVAAFKGGFELRLGQQIIPWGNADIVNPTDFLSSKDFGFFAVDAEDRRLGNVHLWATWTPGGDSPLQLTLVWTPAVLGSTLLVPNGLIPPGVTIDAPVRPELRVENSEVGARVALRRAGWDLAVVGFRGFRHLPEYFLVRRDPTATVVAQTYRRIVAGGGEASLTAGRWIFRFEGAYVATENARDGNKAVQPSFIDAVVGLERPIGDHLRLNAQGLIRYYPSFEVAPVPSTDPAVAQAQLAILRTNQLLLNFQHDIVPGTTVRLAWSSDKDGGGTWEIEGVAVVAFEDSHLRPTRINYLLRPLLTWHASDALRFNVGAEYFGGPLDTPLGALRSFSGVFVGGDYRF